jgi:hypothetical protein
LLISDLSLEGAHPLQASARQIKNPKSTIINRQSSLRVLLIAAVFAYPLLAPEATSGVIGAQLDDLIFAGIIFLGFASTPNKPDAMNQRPRTNGPSWATISGLRIWRGGGFERAKTSGREHLGCGS